MLSQTINISVKKSWFKTSEFWEGFNPDSTVIELPVKLGSQLKIIKKWAGPGIRAPKFSLVWLKVRYPLPVSGFSPDNKYENSFIDKIEANDLIIKDLDILTQKLSLMGVPEEKGYFQAVKIKY